MTIADEVERIQQENIAVGPRDISQMKMLDDVTDALKSVGVSLEPRFEISLESRTSPPLGYYR